MIKKLISTCLTRIKNIFLSLWKNLPESSLPKRIKKTRLCKKFIRPICISIIRYCRLDVDEIDIRVGECYKMLESSGKGSYPCVFRYIYGDQSNTIIRLFLFVVSVIILISLYFNVKDKSLVPLYAISLVYMSILAIPGFLITSKYSFNDFLYKNLSSSLLTFAYAITLLPICLVLYLVKRIFFSARYIKLAFIISFFLYDMCNKVVYWIIGVPSHFGYSIPDEETITTNLAIAIASIIIAIAFAILSIIFFVYRAYLSSDLYDKKYAEREFSFFPGVQIIVVLLIIHLDIVVANKSLPATAYKDFVAFVAGFITMMIVPLLSTRQKKR